MKTEGDNHHQFNIDLLGEFVSFILFLERKEIQNFCRFCSFQNY